MTTAEQDRTSSDRVPLVLRVVGAWGWRILVGVAVLYVALQLLARVMVVVVPVVVALFLAALLEPVVTWLEQRRVPRWLGAWSVLSAVVGVLGLMGWWIATRVNGQFDQLSDQLDSAGGQIRSWLADGPLQLSATRIDQLQHEVADAAQGAISGASGGWMAPARTALEVLAGVVLVAFTLFFVLKDGPRMGQWCMERLPGRRRDDAVVVGSRITQVMRQYLRATAITGVIDGVVIAVALWIIGVPLIIPLAVITAVGAFFPLIGATVAGAVAALVALVSGGPGDAVLVILATVVVQQVEGNLLQPLILGRAVSLHPLVTALSVAAGLVLAGLVGGFLAVPVVASAAHVLHFYRVRPAEPLRPTERSPDGADSDAAAGDGTEPGG